MSYFTKNMFSKTPSRTEVSIQTEKHSEAIADLEVQPLDLPRKTEIWSGRLAMLGFMTTVIAIAINNLQP
jgi:hypothetical protein